MTATQTLPKGVRLLVETKPFVDSERRCLDELTVVGDDGMHWICERKPGSRHYYDKGIVTDWTLA